MSRVTLIPTESSEHYDAYPNVQYRPVFSKQLKNKKSRGNCARPGSI